MTNSPTNILPVTSRQPTQDRVLPLLCIAFEKQARQGWCNQHRKQQGAEERISDGPRHRLEQFALDPLQSEDRQIGGDDDRNGIEHGPLHFVGRCTDALNQRKRSLLGAVQMAHDVFHHHDRAVYNHAKIQGAQTEQIGGNMPQVQADGRKKQREGNRQ